MTLGMYQHSAQPPTRVASSTQTPNPRLPTLFPNQVEKGMKSGLGGSNPGWGGPTLVDESQHGQPGLGDIPRIGVVKPGLVTD